MGNRTGNLLELEVRNEPVHCQRRLQQEQIPTYLLRKLILLKGFQKGSSTEDIMH